MDVGHTATRTVKSSPVNNVAASAALVGRTLTTTCKAAHMVCHEHAGIHFVPVADECDAESFNQLHGKLWAQACCSAA
jgi:hypothetical protein